MALGATTNFWNIAGAEEFSYPLHNLDDAKNIKNRIIESFEKALSLKNEEEIRRTLTFAIVGGGATGVETAAEMAEFIENEIGASFGNKYKDKSKVILIHGSERLMENAPNWLSKKTFKILKKLGVEVILNEKASRLRAGEIMIGNNKAIAADTVVWTAGVKAEEIEIKSEKPIDKDLKTQRIKVNEFLQVPNYHEVFVAGDQAFISDVERDEMRGAAQRSLSFPSRGADKGSIPRPLGRGTFIAPKIHKRTDIDIKNKDGFILGLVQGFAVLPGLSRSGLTVAALLLSKFDEETSIRLSFLMSLPIVLAGNIALNFDYITEFNSDMLIGLLAAFIFGYLTIGVLLKLARKINFGWFVIIFGVLSVAAAFIG
jgi:hypothetical protein